MALPKLIVKQLGVLLIALVLFPLRLVAYLAGLVVRGMQRGPTA